MLTGQRGGLVTDPGNGLLFNQTSRQAENRVRTNVTYGLFSPMYPPRDRLSTFSHSISRFRLTTIVAANEATMQFVKRISMSFVLFGLGIGVFLSSARISQASSLLDQRCGKENAQLQVKGRFWSELSDQTAQRHAISLIPNASASTTPLLALDDNVGAVDFQISQDGQSLGFLTAPRGTPVGSSKSFLTFTVISQPDKKASLPAASNWWQLGPELRSGHFGLLAYDTDLTALIIDLSWADNQVSASAFAHLPFKINRYGPAWQQEVFISPNWDYLAYTSDNSFKIYSMKEKREIWTKGFDHNLIPIIMWSQANNEVGVVNLGGADGNAELLRVDQQGNSEVIGDLSKLIGENVQVTNYTPIVSSEKQLAIGVEPNKTSGQGSRHLILINIPTRQLIDLCFPNPSQSLTWAENGKYLILTTLVDGDPTNILPVPIATETSDYTYPTLSGNSVRVLDWAGTK